MSNNQQPEMQVLHAVDNSSWNTIAVFVPTPITNQSVQLSLPMASHSIIATRPVLINPSLATTSETSLTSTNAVHKNLVIKNKPLRGNIGGVLLRDGGHPKPKVTAPRGGILSQTPSTVIRRAENSGAAMSNVAKETQEKAVELFFRCAQCHGMSRNNVKFCIRCKQPFPPSPNLYKYSSSGSNQIVRVSRETLASSNNVSSKAFYGKTLLAMGYSEPLSSPVCVQKKTLKRIPLKRPLVEPPECLTISSDDEGHDSKEEIQGKELGEDEDTDALGGSSEGDNIDGVHITDHPYAETVINENGTPRPLVAQFKVETIPLKCRSIRVGTYKLAPEYPVIFSGSYITMTLPTVTSEGSELVELSIPFRDLSVIAHFGKLLPIFFVQTTPSCAMTICNRLKMNMDSGPYFDPSSTDETKRGIVLLPETLTSEDRVGLKVLLMNYTGPKLCNHNEGMLREIDQKTANCLLIRATPQEHVAQLTKLSTPNNKRGRLSGSSGKDKDTGVCFARTPVIFPLAKQPKKSEILKVATYPPPPETGGITITSEDLYCLEPGEFLNDVIIDFYLKYVLLEKLSEEDRSRTHVFSSFFYGRLTHPGMPSQQSMRSSLEVEDVTLPPAERRHSRVKTWTRHVDIFQKDFIIVPINENSHWLLAIICFPYLVSKPEEDVASNNENEAIPNERNVEPEEPMDTTEQNGDFTPSDEPTSDGKTGVQTRNSEKEANKKRIPKPCILIFDSLHTRSWTKYVVNLREYLRIEWKTKKRTEVKFDKNTLKGSYPSVPQQTNFSDCGVYVLQYVDSFFENPIMNFTLPIREIVDWFSEETVVKKREDVRKLILRLQKEQSDCGADGEEGAANDGHEQLGDASPSETANELQEALANISSTCPVPEDASLRS